MYKGQNKFDREQLVFVVDAVFDGAFDRIASSLPNCIDHHEYLNRLAEINDFILGAISVVGQTLPVLFAQLTGEGMGTGDFAEFAEFEIIVNDYWSVVTDKPVKKEPPRPDFRPLAEKFVDVHFADYLKSPHIAVEYDPDYQGGDYAKTGRIVYIPLTAVDRYGSVEKAFKKITGLKKKNIVHYTPDEVVDGQGRHIVA